MPWGNRAQVTMLITGVGKEGVTGRTWAPLWKRSWAPEVGRGTGGEEKQRQRDTEETEAERDGHFQRRETGSDAERDTGTESKAHTRTQRHPQTHKDVELRGLSCPLPPVPAGWRQRAVLCALRLPARPSCNRASPFLAQPLPAAPQLVSAPPHLVGGPGPQDEWTEMGAGAGAGIQAGRCLTGSGVSVCLRGGCSWVSLRLCGEKGPLCVVCLPAPPPETRHDHLCSPSLAVLL